MHKQDIPVSIRRWRLTVLVAFYGLLLLFLVNSLSMTIRAGPTTLVIWFIQIFPLLIFLPALHRNYLRAYAWLSFAILIYFVHGVLTSFNSDKLLIGLVETFLSSVIFIALVIYIRKYRNHFKVPL
ncbi:MAG: DUF2069 domain-containing protein [Gammaproteobacteria bacterium]|nr:DUF2069 domain-containing protein [Gammaproteobacteria bacterium]